MPKQIKINCGHKPKISKHKYFRSLAERGEELAKILNNALSETEDGDDTQEEEEEEKEEKIRTPKKDEDSN